MKPFNNVHEYCAWVNNKWNELKADGYWSGGWDIKTNLVEVWEGKDFYNGKQVGWVDFGTWKMPKFEMAWLN